MSSIGTSVFAIMSFIPSLSMIGTRKQWIKTILVTIIVCLCFSYTITSATTVDTVIKNLYTTVSSSPTQTHTLISNFCSSVLSSDAAFTQDDSFVYNAKRSSFVYLLCHDINLVSVGSPGLTDKYFSTTSFSGLGIWDTFCAPVGSMSNDCDLSDVTSKIFNAIMNDYINMKQSGIYGAVFNYTTDDDLNKIVNTYSSAYFTTNICDNDKHSYDATCRMAKSYVKSVRNLLSEVRVFDTDYFLTLPALGKKDVACGSVDTTLNIFYCGFKDTSDQSMASFVNLLYNELFYYRLFMGYYMIMIQNYPEISPHFVVGDSYSTVLKRFSSDYIRSKSAISLSLRMMRDMYVAFPFHIGFSMYQEDLDGFGKELARIAPPIYTLYDKLRNVQQPK